MYIPTVPHVPSPAPPSANAEKLSATLVTAVEEFASDHRHLSPEDVQVALDLARQRLVPRQAETLRTALLLALGMGVLVFGLIVLAGGGL